MTERIPPDCRHLCVGIPSESVSKALAAANEGRIIRISVNPEIVIFVGEKQDYVIVPQNYCSCKDYLLNVVIRRRRRSCYHILAYCIALRIGRVREIVTQEYGVKTLIVRETITLGKSPTLRKLFEFQT